VILAEDLESEEAAKLCALALPVLSRKFAASNDTYHRRDIALTMATAAARAAAPQALPPVRVLSETMHRDGEMEKELAVPLRAILLGLPVGRAHQNPWAVSVFHTALATAFPALPLPRGHRPPRPLPAQDLVELLKHPFCVSEARRAVLDALEFTYQRPFKDQWEFAEYAQKHQPQLDLLTPPTRPDANP
jgi:hypothetical protein